MRQSVDIPMSGEPTLTYTTNAVFRCSRLEALHNKRPAYRFIFIGPEGTWATLVLLTVAMNGASRWWETRRAKSYPNGMSEWLLCAQLVKSSTLKYFLYIPWIRRQLVADRYATKRCFLAGDSATSDLAYRRIRGIIPVYRMR